MKNVYLMVVMAFALAFAVILTGCGKSVDVEGKGMYANTSSGVVGIGSFEVVTVPEGNESARLQYEEDTAWLSPTTKTHAFKVNLSGSNSVTQVGGIVKDICQAFISAGPQIAAINKGTGGSDSVAGVAQDGTDAKLNAVSVETNAFDTVETVK